MNVGSARPKLIAYRTHAYPRMRIVPAALSRNWMDDASGGFAYRCLPMLIANQAGWHILCSHRIVAHWDGGEAIASLTIEHGDGWAPFPASSHFGHGIITWTVPYLFRTTSGYNLLVRGPANMPKDGVHPLEGVVETDWAIGSFTMNWKLTRPGGTVVFEKDEPICMITPQRRGDLESFDPEVRALEEDPVLATSCRAWMESRRVFLRELNSPGSSATWQKHYFQGSTPTGEQAEVHQTRLKIKEFRSSPDE